MHVNNPAGGRWQGHACEDDMHSNVPGYNLIAQQPRTFAVTEVKIGLLEFQTKGQQSMVALQIRKRHEHRAGLYLNLVTLQAGLGRNTGPRQSDRNLPVATEL